MTGIIRLTYLDRLDTAKVVAERGVKSIYTTIMELGLTRPSPVWFWGPNSMIVVYMDPLG